MDKTKRAAIVKTAWVVLSPPLSNKLMR